MRFIIILFMLISTSAQAVDPWQVSANVMLAADWLQTREIAINPEFEEMNPILGSNPSLDKVDLYYLSCFAVLNAVGPFLDKDTSNTLYKAVTIFEGAVVLYNGMTGVRFNMRF